jgi:arylsulfatase A
MRSGDWKLLEYFEDGHVELYNLKDDPAETQDRAATNPQKAAELRRLLRHWRRFVGAEVPGPNPAHRGP